MSQAETPAKINPHMPRINPKYNWQKCQWHRHIKPECKATPPWCKNCKPSTIIRVKNSQGQSPTALINPELLP